MRTIITYAYLVMYSNRVSSQIQHLNILPSSKTLLDITYPPPRLFCRKMSQTTDPTPKKESSMVQSQSPTRREHPYYKQRTYPSPSHNARSSIWGSLNMARPATFMHLPPLFPSLPQTQRQLKSSLKSPFQISPMQSACLCQKRLQNNSISVSCRSLHPQPLNP